jgi:hypothetical protein
MIFDVPLAEQIVKEKPRKVIALSRRELWHYARREEVKVRHLAHVDRSKPGIMGLVRIGGKIRRVLIEGHHRAYRCRLESETYRVFMLTESETARCLK